MRPGPFRSFAPRCPDDRACHQSVVLVSLDTLRADHLSGYGYPRPTSLALDHLVLERGATFTGREHDVPDDETSRTRASSPATIPAGCRRAACLGRDADSHADRNLAP
mgnify:CR=1 FL=1